jgi:hypothetical protein
VMDIFGKGFAAVVFITLSFLVLGKASSIARYYSSYILIFLISSVYLLQSLRHLMYNDDERELRKFNLSYSLVTILAAFILGSATVRGFLGYILKGAYDGFVWIIVYLISWLLVPLGYLIELLVQGFKAIGLKRQLQPLLEMMGDPEPTPQSAAGNKLDFLLPLKDVLQVSFNILIIFLLFYGLFKLLRRHYDSGQETEEYRESRESILSLGKKIRFPKISRIFAPRNGVEAIRHYYKKFLLIALKREINILRSDTTSEIKKKGETHFETEVLGGT